MRILVIMIRILGSLHSLTCILFTENDATSANRDDPQPSKRGRKERHIIWKSVEVGQKSTEVPEWKGKLPDATTIKTPLEYFKHFFDDDLLQMIVDESNLYATQERGSSLNLTVEELEQFIGTVLYSTIFHLPRTRRYWKKSSWVQQIAEVFSRNRWEEIKKYIHFNDNSNMPAPTDETRDKLFKIRPIVDKLLHKFQAIPQQQMLCIDEQIVPFKGRSGLKQYNPKKPNKWGYKIFVLCDTNGLVHNFEIYTGKIEPAPNEPDLGASSNIVLRLTSIVQVNMSHLLFFDNWFSSLDLVIELHKKGIYTLGTVRQNRLKGCRLIDDKRMKKLGRGTYDEKSATVEGIEVDVLKWCDTKCVTFISTYAAGDPPGVAERWSKKEKQFIDVACPNVVLEYNKFMGGVDLLDGLVSYYRTKLKSKKYYMRFFFHFLDMVTVNCWLLYRRDGRSLEIPPKKQIDLLDFRAEVAEGVLKCKKDTTRTKSRRSSSDVEKKLLAKKKKGRVAPTPAKDIRMDSVGHWPIPSERQRCKHPGCKNKATIKCSKCQVHLCLNKKSNCYLLFHTQ
ncbi:piggyBac transposable element-derived protein 2-like isoform X1 [Scylla paramamosain]|uniref:piggyBac transposable element-derived protein 2-like isoform X1 n=2 Tax=Scylla paramamosain TaxID=85552 RepID=UPI003083A420